MTLKKTHISAKRLGISTAENIVRYIFLIAYSYVLLYPLFYIFINSFKSQADFLDPTVQWVLKSATLDNFRAAIKTLDFWNALKNTAINEMLSAVIEIVSCAVAAYGLARFEFKGKKLLMGMMILTILVPTNMIIIPSYVNFRYMDFLGVLGGIGKLVGKELRPNLIGTPWVFWLPSILATGLKSGLFIFLYTQFFRGLPKELEEAAWVDGAGPWKTFLKIIVPSSSVPIVIVALFSVVWHWNDFFVAQMYMSDNATISVNLANFTQLFGTYISVSGESELSVGPVVMAACVLCLLPMVIYYLILQRKFIASIANSGIVG